MKIENIISRFHHIIYGLIVLGLFANAAQNAYGFRLILYSLLIFSLLCLIEVFFDNRNNSNEPDKVSNLYRIESLLVGFYFIGFSYGLLDAAYLEGSESVYPWWIGLLGLTILYLLYLAKELVKPTIIPRSRIVLEFLIYLNSLAALWIFSIYADEIYLADNALPFILALTSVSLLFLVLLLSVFRPSSFNFNGRLEIFTYLALRPGKVSIVLTFFVLCNLYFALIRFDVVPEMYSLDPPELKTIADPSKKAEFIENFRTFVEHRRESEY